MHPHSQTQALRETGAYLHGRGWCLATSSNYSVVLERAPLRLLLTASGKDKGRLGAGDFVTVGEDGAVLDGAPNRPSAEMWLHLVLARHGGAGAVLHTHSVWGTLLSDVYGDAGAVPLQGYEMLKAFEGLTTHEATKRVPIFPNTQDIPALVKELTARLTDAGEALQHGFLIRNHGLYAWGATLDDARRHIEAFEFLFEVLGRKLSLAGGL